MEWLLWSSEQVRVREVAYGFGRKSLGLIEARSDGVALTTAGLHRWTRHNQGIVPVSELIPPPQQDAPIVQGAMGNALLQHLGATDFLALQPFMTRVELPLGMQLASAGDPIHEVCFPEACVIGFADVLEDGQRLAIGLVGREGFVGWPLALANRRWSHDAVVRAESGTAIRIPADALIEAMAARPSLRETLLRYTSSFVSQMARTIASNLMHPVERRAARWILMYHDRARSDEIALTHEELGVMLGVRRASITDALHQIESSGAIRGHRGRFVIRDRQPLLALAGETYGFAEAEYIRLLGMPSG